MGLLTWCEDCGDDMFGDSYVCEKCGQELCYSCYQQHLKDCYEIVEEE